MNKSFVFVGQGSQVVGMAKDFYENFDVAKNVFKEVDQALNKNLSKIIFEGDEALLTQTENAQPAIMCASIAMLKVLESESGLSIDKLCKNVAGHSLGEYTALCAAGAISLSDTAKLLKVRGESFGKAATQSKGGMVAFLGVNIPQIEEVVNKAKQPGEICKIANDNATGQVVISGHEKSIDKAIEVAQEMGIKKIVKLQTSGAFHTDLMSPAVKPMKEALNGVNILKPIVPLISNVSVEATDNPEKIKENLIKQITNEVRWRETIFFFENNGIEEVVQFGPGKALAVATARTTTKDMKNFAINSVDTMKEYLLNIK